MIDAHAHLDFDPLSGDIQQVLVRAAHQGVRAIVSAGYCPENMDKQVALLSHSVADVHVFIAPGLHPWAVSEHSDRHSLQTRLALLDSKLSALKSTPQFAHVCALGECGLDYYRASSDAERALHREAFLHQLALAREYELPAIIHAVKCHDDLLAILRDNPSPFGFQLHGYSGPESLIRPLQECGAVFSFGTPLTWKGQKKIKRALKEAYTHFPECWMLETDAPDRPVTQTNLEHGEPADLRHVVQSVSEVLELDEDDVSILSARNADDFFGLSRRMSRSIC